MGKNFNGVQMNNSPTIVEKAGAAITDCRNRIMKYDGNGDVVLATAGTDIPVGMTFPVPNLGRLPKVMISTSR